MLRFEGEEKSSFRSALREHASLCVRAASALVRIFEDPGEGDAMLRELHGLAERGDVLLYDTLRHIIRARNAPFELGAVQDMIIALDAMLDEIVPLGEQVAMLSVRRRQSTAIALARLLHGCCRQFHLVTLNARPELRVLVDLGVLIGTAEVLHRRGAADASDMRDAEAWRRVFGSFQTTIRAADRVSMLIETTILERA